jgi:lysophospholipase L1-like esterase
MLNLFAVMGKKFILYFFAPFIIVSIFLEIIFRLCYPVVSNYNMEMWRYARELKVPALCDDLPFEHAANKRSLLCGVEIRTNSLGLRAEKDYILPKPAHTKRILALGDSITMGWGVEFKDTYASRLEALLNKGSSQRFEVINAGVGNYNSVCELAALKKFINLEPDLIILGFYINDLERAPSLCRLSYLAKRYSFLYAFISARVINIRYNFSYRKYYSMLYNDKKLRQDAKDAILEMAGISSSRSIPFMLVNIPELHNFKDYYFKEAQYFVQDIVKGHPEIIFIDLLETLKDRDAGEFWISAQDPHPNPGLHGIIAEEAYKRLKAL